MLHERVAARLIEDPAIRERAMARVEQWRRSGAVASEYVDAWSRLLERPIDEVVATLQSPSEEAAALRQVSPFAGVLSPSERWDLLKREKAQRDQP